MNSTAELSLRAVIITALPIECQEVRAHMFHLHPESHPEGSVYWSGFFPCESCRWDVKVAEIGSGNTETALETERAISYFKPHVALFVGVAGGLKDVDIGDVVVAEEIYSYESGKASDTFLPRPKMKTPTRRMLQWARITIASRDWVQRIKGRTSECNLKALVGPVAAGEKVLSSMRSKIYTFLCEQYSSAVAVEMEGYGFLQAIHANQNINAIVIRGISDLIEGKYEADAANSQELASRHASAFAFEMLSKLGSDKHFLATVAKTKPSKKTSQERQTMVKYSVTNSGQMAVGPNSHVTVFNNGPQSKDE